MHIATTTIAENCWMRRHRTKQNRSLHTWNYTLKRQLYARWNGNRKFTKSLWNNLWPNVKCHFSPMEHWEWFDHLLECARTRIVQTIECEYLLCLPFQDECEYRLSAEDITNGIVFSIFYSFSLIAQVCASVSPFDFYAREIVWTRTVKRRRHHIYIVSSYHSHRPFVRTNN